MNVGSSLLPIAAHPAALQAASPSLPSVAGRHEDGEMRQVFDQFVGETFYGQMLAAMRKTVGKPAYFHGGRGEEVFREQLDHVLAQEMTKRNASDLTGSMYQLFQLGRK